MKRTIAVACMVLAGYPAAFAQVLGGDQYITIGGGYAFGTLKASGESVDGGGLGLNLDHRGFGDKPMSLAITFGYSELEQKEEDSVGFVQRTVSTWPLGIGAKAWLGQSRTQGYLGAVLTVYFSSLKTTTEGASESYTSVSKSGWGLAVPVGVAFNISERTFINVGYTLNWLWENDVLESDLIHSFIAGLGFQLN